MNLVSSLIFETSDDRCRLELARVSKSDEPSQTSLVWDETVDVSQPRWSQSSLIKASNCPIKKKLLSSKHITMNLIVECTFACKHKVQTFRWQTVIMACGFHYHTAKTVKR